MLSHHEINLLGQEIILDPAKAIYWKNRKILVVSDLHFGKAGHFRKYGIAVPALLHETDFLVLSQLIDAYKPTSIIFLGDLFHSEVNNQWLDIVLWLKKHEDIPIDLVKGNHDILPNELYDIKNLTIHEEELVLEPFIFTHKPMDSDSQELYNIAGHIHPAVTLKGKARQSLKLPCFYFGKKYGILPAFGTFTGNSLFKINKNDLIYIITNNSVVSAVIS